MSLRSTAYKSGNPATNSDRALCMFYHQPLLAQEAEAKAMTALTLKAAVIRESGAPEVPAVEDLPVPKPALGWVLIRV